MNTVVGAVAEQGAQRRFGWRVAFSVFALSLAVLIGCYWQTAASLVYVWAHDGTYQYAFLIFPLSAWTAFNLRGQVRAVAPVPSAWGAAAVAVLVLVWYAGHMLSVNLPQHFAFVALLPALVLACWGWRALRTLQFPLAYLVVFAVPWGDSMVGPLQDITAHMAVAALNATGVPVLMNGREIITPVAVWMVEAACSGVKFFIACTALGSLFAYLMYNRAWKRVGFVLIAAVAPIVANGLRVYFTVLIGETWGLQYATGTDHMIFGWQFFGAVLIALMLFGWFLRDRWKPVEKPPIADKGPVSARLALWLAVLALLIAAPVVAGSVAAPAPPESLTLAAPTLRGWHGPAPADQGWRPVFAGSAGAFQAAYRRDGESVEAFHAVYTGIPRRGHNLITYGNDVYGAAYGHILAARGQQVTLADGRHVSARELRMGGPGGPRFIWYWYCVDAHCGASPVLAKLWQAWAVLRGHPLWSSVWAISRPIVNGDDAAARAQLAAFAHGLPVGAAADADGDGLAARGAGT